MKIKGRVTPAMRRMVLDLHGQGLSHRKIEAAMTEAGTPLSRTGVADIIRAASGTPAAPPPEPSPASPAPTLAEVDIPLPTLPPDAPIAAQVLWAELLELRAAARSMYPRVLVGEFPMTQWVAAKTHVLRLMRSLEEMLPPPKPDPASDPTNIAAREMVHGHVLRTIRAAEERSGRICPECRRALRAER